MKPFSCGVSALLGAAALVLSATAALADDHRYIIQFEPGAASGGKAAVQAVGGQIHVDLTDRAVNAIAVTLPPQALQGLQNNPNVVLIEVDERIYPQADEVPYGISMVQADQVSDEFAGNQRVCVIDSGYYIGHVDLQSHNVTASPDSGSGDPFIDPCGHGTHVAGTIAALANGGGVLGVMPGGNVGLHIVKVFGNDNWGGTSCTYSYSSTLAAAAYECADAGSTVINMSLSGGYTSTNEQAFADLYENHGILSVASAGNGGNTQYAYPASYDAVISVAAIDSNKNLASFSQRNDQVELSGPGVGVLSTVPHVGANVVVNGQDYVVSQIDRSASTSASGNLVNGGLCTSVGSWSGRVVLCERGQTTFAQKIANVESGGGVAAVIYNNEPGGFSGGMSCNGPSWRACSNIPAVSMSQADGQALASGSIGVSAQVSTVSSAPGNGYAYYSGTSMSAPHVAAVAALVWSHAPSLGPSDIRAALAATAEDLGTAGRNNQFGYGLVQAHAALEYILDGDPGPGPDPDPDPNQPPVASFGHDCTDLACTFDGSASSDSDGNIVSYSWTFGDGNNGSGVVVGHEYAGAGTYTVTLTVTDNDGDSDSTSTQVTVDEPADPGDPGEIQLSGNGYKVQGRWTADLSWSGAQGSQVTVIRNGSVVATVNNTGSHTDSTNIRGSGSLSYQVCETGGGACSATITVNF